jgi:hypothetical protein
MLRHSEAVRLGVSAVGLVALAFGFVLLVFCL